ncbi:MAG: hypothetical protein ACRYG7_06220 [Janthinobacterium lividum]
MNAPAFLLAAALLLPTLGAAAQTLEAGPGAPALPGAYPAPTPQLPASTSSLTYFGVVNSQDAGHAQFAQLRQAFESYRPTLVVVEKPDCGTASTAEATISSKGAAGYARLLAQQHQVPTERLDDPLAEYAYLRTKVDAEQLKLYYLLREARRFRQRTGASKALTVKAMQALLANSEFFVPGTEQVIRNVGELETAYRHYCPDGGQWWRVPAACFTTQATAYPSGSFFKAINGTIGEYRERYVYGRLAARARAGERILVVMSHDQLPTPTAAGAVAAK